MQPVSTVFRNPLSSGVTRDADASLGDGVQDVDGLADRLPVRMGEKRIPRSLDDPIAETADALQQTKLVRTRAAPS